jgi:hypothetical protein
MKNLNAYNDKGYIANRRGGGGEGRKSLGKVGTGFSPYLNPSKSFGLQALKYALVAFPPNPFTAHIDSYRGLRVRVRTTTFPNSHR